MKIVTVYFLAALYTTPVGLLTLNSASTPSPSSLSHSGSDTADR